MEKAKIGKERRSSCKSVEWLESMESRDSSQKTSNISIGLTKIMGKSPETSPIFSHDKINLPRFRGDGLVFAAVPPGRCRKKPWLMDGLLWMAVMNGFSRPGNDIAVCD